MVKTEGQAERLGKKGAGRQEMHLEVSRCRYRGRVGLREQLRFFCVRQDFVGSVRSRLGGKRPQWEEQG